MNKQIKTTRNTMMKKLMLFLTLLIPTLVFAEMPAGTHHFTLNAGGTFGASFFKSDYDGYTPRLFGGGYTFELGYMYLIEDYSFSGMSLAIDGRFSFGQTFSPTTNFTGYGISESTGHMTTTHFYVGATFALGVPLYKGSLLVDVLGINLGCISGQILVNDLSGNVDLGNAFLLSATLPLGLQYVFDTGLMVGFRQRLDFAFGVSPEYKNGSVDSGGWFGTGSEQSFYMAYNITVTVGYAFGR